MLKTTLLRLPYRNGRPTDFTPFDTKGGLGKLQLFSNEMNEMNELNDTSSIMRED
jgi:hypothetical protein